MTTKNMVMEPGKLYKTNDAIWIIEWIPANQYLIFISSKNISKTWNLCKFVYKNKIVELQIHEDQLSSNLFTKV